MHQAGGGDEAAALRVTVAQGASAGPIPKTLTQSLAGDLDCVVLDHHIGEQLLAHLLDRGAGLGRVRLGQFDLYEFALANIFDTGKAERTERVLDGLSLGIEDAVLECDMDARLHEINPLCRCCADAVIA
jgi:hypothetical protein